MRIVVHGQQAFGKAVLEALLKRGEDVIAAYVAPERPGAKADPLKEAALAAQLPVYQPDTYKKPEVWNEFKALKPDLQVMAFVTLFVPEEFLNIPTHGNDGAVNPVYAGDYDGLTSDFLKAPGFIGAFMSVNSQANPDVKAVSFQ